MSQDLKPCPFCGGPAELWQALDGRPAWVACLGRCSVLVTRDHTTTEDAIAAWNRRADIHDTALAAAKAEGIREGMLKAAAECQNWLDTFGEIEINFTQAREYACDAVSDLRDNFTAVGGAP